MKRNIIILLSIVLVASAATYNGKALVLIRKLQKDTMVLADYSKMIHKELRNQIGAIIQDSIKNKKQ